MFPFTQRLFLPKVSNLYVLKSRVQMALTRLLTVAFSACLFEKERENLPRGV